MRNLDQKTATLFGRLSSACVSFRLGGNQIVDARVPSLGDDPGQNVLREYGLHFDNLNVLNEHGLIISDYNSRYDYMLCIGFVVPEHVHTFVRIPFAFQGRNWVLVPTEQRKVQQEFRLSGVALTKSGRELLAVVDLEPLTGYAQALIEFLEKDNLKMIEVDG